MNPFTDLDELERLLFTSGRLVDPPKPENWFEVAVTSRETADGFKVFSDKCEIDHRFIVNLNAKSKALGHYREETQARFMDVVPTSGGELIPLELVRILDRVNKYNCALCLDRFFDWRDEDTLKFDRNTQKLICRHPDCRHVICAPCWKLVEPLTTNELVLSIFDEFSAHRLTCAACFLTSPVRCPFVRGVAAKLKADHETDHMMTALANYITPRRFLNSLINPKLAEEVGVNVFAF